MFKLNLNLKLKYLKWVHAQPQINLMNSLRFCCFFVPSIFFAFIRDNSYKKIRFFVRKYLFKTKLNKTISEEFRKKVRTVFHHLTKEELIEKVLANYLAQATTSVPKTETANKKKKH